MNRPDTVHIQLQRLMQQGLTPDEACSALRNLGFTERELGTFTTTIGGRVTQYIGRAAGPPRRSTARVEARSNSLPDPDPLFRGWDKPPTRRWDKVISRARLAWRVTLQVATTVLVFAGMAFLAEHANSSFLPFILFVCAMLGGQILGRTWFRR